MAFEKSLPLIAFSLLTVAAIAQAEPKPPKFVIHVATQPSEPSPSFTEGGKTFTVGMPMQDFIVGFGPPDRTFTDGKTAFEAEYATERMFVDFRDGRLSAVHFFFDLRDGYFMSGSYDQPPKREWLDDTLGPVNAATIEGIGAGSTARETVLAYGTPLADNHSPDDAQRSRALHYPNASFIFGDGRLNGISICTTQPTPPAKH